MLKEIYGIDTNMITFLNVRLSINKYRKMEKKEYSITVNVLSRVITDSSEEAEFRSISLIYEYMQ